MDQCLRFGQCSGRLFLVCPFGVFLETLGDALVTFGNGKAETGNGQSPVHEKIDLLGVKCPFNYVKTKLKLETMQTGQRLEVLLDDGEPSHNVPKSVKNDGHKLVLHKQENGHHKIIIEKA